MSEFQLTSYPGTTGMPTSTTTLADTVYANIGQTIYIYPGAPPEPPISPSDPVAWLKRRVEDICWRAV